MKRWRAPAASRTRHRCYAHARLARGEIASTLANRSHATKTITGIDRRRHKGEHYDECTRTNKQACSHLLSHFFTFSPILPNRLDHFGAKTSVLDVGYRSRFF